MSYSNFIRKLLDIQGNNITFDKNPVQIQTYKDKISKFILATLTYTPTHCDCCGVINEDYTIYKNGTKTS